MLPRRRGDREAAGCARSTAYEAIRALEQVGVLSWVNRIKRVRKYLNELIEKYFSAFLDEVTERGVSVNETMGDGFMAIFQQPNPMQNAAAATETALGVFAATERIN